MAADPTKPEIRAGDTKVYDDVLTDTVSGDPIDAADLTDGTWEVSCQIRANYATTSPVVAEFTCEATGPATIRRMLTEVESLKLDAVAFDPKDTAKTATRKVYWDAQIRKTDGLDAGQPYVLTYLSGSIKILGQVSRAD